MRRLGIGLLIGITAYLVAAVLGFLLVLLLSSNTHDRDLEAAMSGAFVFGPLAALIGFVVGVIKGGARRGLVAGAAQQAARESAAAYPEFNASVERVTCVVGAGTDQVLAKTDSRGL